MWNLELAQVGDDGGWRTAQKSDGESGSDGEADCEAGCWCDRGTLPQGTIIGLRSMQMAAEQACLVGGDSIGCDGEILAPGSHMARWSICSGVHRLPWARWPFCMGTIQGAGLDNLAKKLHHETPQLP